MKRIYKLTAALLSCAMLAGAAGCTQYESGNEKVYTYEEAIKELNAFNDQIHTDTIKPRLDIYNSETAAKTLADIKTFPLTVEGSGSIDIEVAAATEMSSDAPDDWLNIVAENFNRSGAQLNGKTVSVTVRKITSGEVLTYMTESDYRPDVYAPSSEAWGQMLSAKGINTITLADRIAGNTAGVLMEKNTYDTFTEKYGEVTLANVLDASRRSDLCLHQPLHLLHGSEYPHGHALRLRQRKPAVPDRAAEAARLSEAVAACRLYHGRSA